MADNPQTEIEVLNDAGNALPVSDANLTSGNQQTKLKGNTDGTLIGNVGDAMKVVLTTNGPKTFGVRAASIAIGNGKSMLSLVNASGSTVKVKIREIYIKNVQTTGVTGILGNFELNKIVNHSVGTALTPTAHDSTDTLDSSVTARTGGTVTSEGATYRRWVWSTDEFGAGPADAETAEHTSQNLIPHFLDTGNWKTITLNANEGIHIKQTINSTVGTFDLEIVFTTE